MSMVSYFSPSLELYDVSTIWGQFFGKKLSGAFTLPQPMNSYSPFWQKFSIIFDIIELCPFCENSFLFHSFSVFFSYIILSSCALKCVLFRNLPLACCSLFSLIHISVTNPSASMPPYRYEHVSFFTLY